MNLTKDEEMVLQLLSQVEAMSVDSMDNFFGDDKKLKKALMRLSAFNLIVLDPAYYNKWRLSKRGREHLFGESKSRKIETPNIPVSTEDFKDGI